MLTGKQALLVGPEAADLHFKRGQPRQGFYNFLQSFAKS